MRLSPTGLSALPPAVARFDYDRSAPALGMVHLGIGAFHRAHQAWYTHAALNGGARAWAITGVSLRSSEVATQMNPQAGLYTVTERAAAGTTTRVIGAVRSVLVAPNSPVQLAEALAAPATRIVSLTVTEKGYGRAADGSLDPALAGPASIYPLLARALRQRHDAGHGGLTLLSCDNLSDNGAQLARLLGQYLDRHDPALVGWFGSECTCPSSMVDRIVPATTDEDRATLADALGMTDEAAVFTEPFSQWVIEDRFAGERPRWDRVGAQLASDIAPYETAKLRMLNGAHSALAYLGLERGHSFVHEAIADPAIRPLVERLMRQEAAGSFVPAAGQDPPAYAAALLARFANPALNHRLAQIAMDGSQKIPQRWLATLASRGATACPAIIAALAGWLRHLRNGKHWSDPRADELRALWQACGEAGIAAALFGEAGAIPSAWCPTADDLRRLTAATTKPILGEPL